MRHSDASLLFCALSLVNIGFLFFILFFRLLLPPPLFFFPARNVHHVPLPLLPEQLVVIVMQPATFNQRNYGVLYFFSFLLNRFSLILLARNSASIFFRKKQQLSG